MPYNSTPNNLPIRKIRRRTMIGYTAAMLLTVATATILLFLTLGRTADEKESRLIESGARNTTLAADNYIKDCESECNEVFVNETILKYSPCILSEARRSSGYEQSKAEIKGQLSKISAGKCYNDFFLIYSNSDTIGNVSQVADDVTAKSGYSLFAETLDGSSDKWVFGEFGEFTKIYYLRRLNEDAIFVMSCYTGSLNIVFPSYHTDSEVDYLLTDESGSVIFSDIKKIRSGNHIPSKYSSLFHKENESVIDDYYIASRIKMKNGWTVYAVTTNSDFFPSYTVVLTITLIGMSAVVLISLLTGILAFSIGPKQSEQITGGEYLDPVTGTLNEYGLDEMISEVLETSLVGSTYAFIMIGIKDHEQIKSTVSLRYWNDIRLALAEKAESFFENRKHHIGRAYDDYITVFADYSEFDLFKAHDELKKSCEELYRSFEDFTAGDDGTLKLDITIGASIYPDDGDDFDTLLGKARQAYKLANHREKNRFGIYKNPHSDEKEKEES